MTYNDEIIRDYLQNKLSSDQVAKFKERMDADEAFAEEVEFQQLLLESMEAKSFMDVVASVQKETEKSESASTNTQPESKGIAKRSILRWTSFAAAAAIVAALFFFPWGDVGNSQTDLLALADKYTTTVDLPVDRSSDNPWQPSILENELEIPFLEAEESIKLNYTTPEETKARIADLKGDLNPLRILLLGDLHAKQKQPDKAHLYFDLLLDGRFTDFEPQARWHKALLLLNQKKAAEAKVLLGKLANLKRDTPIKKSARSLLDELPSVN